MTVMEQSGLGTAREKQLTAVVALQIRSGLDVLCNLNDGGRNMRPRSKGWRRKMSQWLGHEKGNLASYLGSATIFPLYPWSSLCISQFPHL